MTASEQAAADAAAMRAARFAEAALPNSLTVVFTESQARKLTGENKGLIYVTDPLRGNEAARDFQAATSGAFSDIALGKNTVPALRYDNPAASGYNYVKFDGIETSANGTTTLLIDAKTKLATWSEPTQRDVLGTLERVKAALSQNPGYSVVYEFPNQEVARRAFDFIKGTEYANTVSVRVRVGP